MEPRSESGGRKGDLSFLGRHNVYTAILALTTLILAVTSALVSIYGWQMYGQVFGVSGLP